MKTFEEFWDEEKIEYMRDAGEYLQIEDFDSSYLASKVKILSEEENFKLVRVNSSLFESEDFILYDNELYDQKAFSKDCLCDYLSFKDPKNLDELVRDINSISNFERVQIWYDFYNQRYWIDNSNSCLHDFKSACLKTFSRGEQNWTEDDLSLIFDTI